MKTMILNLALAAALAAAQPHNHGHGHLHQKKSDNSPIEARDEVVEYVAAYATVYKLGDKDVSAAEANAGIEEGLYIVVGETTPTMSTPSSSATPSTVTSKLEAQFIEKTSTTSSTSSTSTTSEISSSTSTTSTTSAAATTSSATSTSSSSASWAKGINAEFPSGEYNCSVFPSDYGAVAVDWLGTGGWTSIQYTPYYTLGDTSISYIVTGVSGDSCTENAFCAYACPAGYVMSQWPEDCQGSTGESIGGLYCNTDGKLELTRSDYKTLCVKGVGGVSVKNEMSDNVAVCRTQYPGTESMVIPLNVESGDTYEIANIDSSSYYVWEGKSTTLQYYINPAGVSVEDGCVWTSPEPYTEKAGNWAAVNLGVGRDSTGVTYLSLFPNTPTSSASPEFDITITGTYSGDCYIKSGEYAGSSSGCTISIPEDGSVVLVFQDSS